MTADESPKQILSHEPQQQAVADPPTTDSPSQVRWSAAWIENGWDRQPGSGHRRTGLSSNGVITYPRGLRPVTFAKKNGLGFGLTIPVTLLNTENPGVEVTLISGVDRFPRKDESSKRIHASSVHFFNGPSGTFAIAAIVRPEGAVRSSTGPDAKNYPAKTTYTVIYRKKSLFENLKEAIGKFLAGIFGGGWIIISPPEPRIPGIGPAF
uniref:Uncharacterized protein n=1 Tax=Oscillatoriales cyanobacterium SpSt-402 TaxID=2282168 RepID=A0A832H0I3_9CYAN